MGQIANQLVKNGKHSQKTISNSLASTKSNLAQINSLKSNLSSNLTQASQSTPILSQTSDLFIGTTQGDLGNMVLNAGILASASIPVSSHKLASNSISRSFFVKASGLSCLQK